MKLIQKFLTESGCYRAGRKIAVKGLMIHSVGCPQPKASVFMKNWDKADAGACVHAIVEPGGDVYQLLPWDYRGWHCGGDGNGTHIGVEMTEPATIRYTGGSAWTETGDGRGTRDHVLAAYGYAVELFAYLCQMFGLDPLADGVVVSHSEGHRRGLQAITGTWSISGSGLGCLWGSFGRISGRLWTVRRLGMTAAGTAVLARVFPGLQGLWGRLWRRRSRCGSM